MDAEGRAQGYGACHIRPFLPPACVGYGTARDRRAFQRVEQNADRASIQRRCNPERYGSRTWCLAEVRTANERESAVVCETEVNATLGTWLTVEALGCGGCRNCLLQQVRVQVAQLSKPVWRRRHWNDAGPRTH